MSWGGQGAMADLSATEREILRLIDRYASYIEERRVESMCDLVRAGEPVIAFENLCSNLDDGRVSVGQDDFAAITRVGGGIGIDPSYWERLEPGFDWDADRAAIVASLVEKCRGAFPEAAMAEVDALLAAGASAQACERLTLELITGSALPGGFDPVEWEVSMMNCDLHEPQHEELWKAFKRWERTTRAARQD